MSEIRPPNSLLGAFGAKGFGMFPGLHFFISLEGFLEGCQVEGTQRLFSDTGFSYTEGFRFDGGVEAP